MDNHIKGALLVCLAATMWGFDGIALTPRLFNLHVPFVVFILHLLPLILMSIIFGKEEIKNIKKLQKNDLFFFFCVALFGGCLGTLSIVKALFLVNFKHLTVVTLLQKLQPIFAIILARLLLKEKLKRAYLFWGFLALLGGYLLTFEFHLPEFVSSDNLLPASLYSLLAAFSFGSATVFGKRILKSASFRTALYLRYLMTTCIMFVIVAFTSGFGDFLVATPKNWLIFIIIALTTGRGAILLYYFGLRYITAKVATMCELCFPISSVVFDYLINGNVLSPVQLFSAGLMILSIIKISRLN